MKFFIPQAPPDLAEEVYQTLRQSFPNPPTERRIFRLEYNRNGENHTAQVGEIGTEFVGLVLAVLEYPGLYVFSCVKGEIHKGQPRLAPNPEHHFIPTENVIRVEDFEKG
jgi:hypothetical protein